jgi:hypothetical protein
LNAGIWVLLLVMGIDVLNPSYGLVVGASLLAILI